MTAETVRHAEDVRDHRRTACGEAILGKNLDNTIVLLAAPGSVVTCYDCRCLLAFAQDKYTSNFRRRRD